MVRVRKRTIELRDGVPVSMPQVIGTPRMDFDEFVLRVSDGGEVAATEVVASFARLERALTRALADGNRVETPIGTFSVSLGAGERDDAGGFRLSGRNARINFRPAKQLLQEVRERINLEEESDVTVRRPIPERLENSVAGVQLDRVHPTELVYIMGKNLDFDHQNEDEGVFFITAKSKATRAASYGRSHAGRLALVIPPLTAGPYTVEVRALRDEEGIQSGTLPMEITLESAGSTGTTE